MLTSDCDLLDELLSDKLIFTNQDRLRLTKQDDILAHFSGLLQIERLEFSAVSVREIAKGVVVFVVVAVSGQYDGQSFGGTYAYTRLWTNHDAKWQVEVANCSTVTAAI